MRVEWAEGRARVERWAEEIALRSEEMRRSTVTLLYMADKWSMLINSRSDVSPTIRAGLNAYAARQSTVFKGLAHLFYSLWSPALKELKIKIDWPISLLVEPTAATHLTGVADYEAIASITIVRSDILVNDFNTVLPFEATSKNKYYNDSREANQVSIELTKISCMAYNLIVK
jgi:hypothetical protein